MRPDLAANLSATFRSWDWRGLINRVRSVLIDRDSSLDALDSVKAPTLVVSGKKDPVLPAPHSRAIVARIPNSLHVEVEEAAHLVPPEAPVEANRLIQKFFKSLAPG